MYAFRSCEISSCSHDCGCMLHNSRLYTTHWWHLDLFFISFNFSFISACIFLYGFVEEFLAYLDHCEWGETQTMFPVLSQHLTQKTDQMWRGGVGGERVSTQQASSQFCSGHQLSITPIQFLHYLSGDPTGWGLSLPDCPHFKCQLQVWASRTSDQLFPGWDSHGFLLCIGLIC